MKSIWKQDVQIYIGCEMNYYSDHCHWKPEYYGYDKNKYEKEKQGEQICIITKFTFGLLFSNTIVSKMMNKKQERQTLHQEGYGANIENLFKQKITRERASFVCVRFFWMGSKKERKNFFEAFIQRPFSFHWKENSWWHDHKQLHHYALKSKHKAAKNELMILVWKVIEQDLSPR